MTTTEPIAEPLDPPSTVEERDAVLRACTRALLELAAERAKEQEAAEETDHAEQPER